MKPRTCPNCEKIIPVDSGFSYDEKNNMICDNCGKAIIATNWEKEPTNYGYAIRAGITQAHSYGSTWKRRWDDAPPDTLPNSLQ